MKEVNVMVLSGYGLNCDNETAYAFELAGGKADRVHINSLIDGSIVLKDYKIFVLTGGFSWGDDHGAGVVQAIRMRTQIGNQISKFIEKGNLVLGICNGFQTLVNMGLLPGFNNDYISRKVALIYNDCGNFRDQWVKLRVNETSPCVFTKNLKNLEYPVRHGEGKFYSDKETIEKLVKNNQVVLQYAKDDFSPAEQFFPHNPNGSINDIAGICDSTGRIFGLMPHPEAYNHFTNHPNWTRKKNKAKRGNWKLNTDITDGIKLFKNAVDFFKV